MPADAEAERNRKCADIRIRIAIERSPLPPMVANSGFAPAYKIDAAKRVAELESQYAELQCEVIRVVPGTPVVPPAGTAQKMSFDQCFKKCQELTQRTPEQCFDSCK